MRGTTFWWREGGRGEGRGHPAASLSIFEGRKGKGFTQKFLRKRERKREKKRTMSAFMAEGKRGGGKKGKERAARLGEGGEETGGRKTGGKKREAHCRSFPGEGGRKGGHSAFFIARRKEGKKGEGREDARA